VPTPTLPGSNAWGSREAVRSGVNVRSLRAGLDVRMRRSVPVALAPTGVTGGPAGGWQTGAVREWLVGSALIEGPGGFLLVKNRRRDGRFDWSPPGGVIDEGEDVLGGLTREVEEETGLVVTRWEGPLYSVEAEAEGMGWHLRVEVHRALEYSGELHVDDPDGIVVDAQFMDADACGAELVAGSWLPTHEPIVEWLAERWTEQRGYRYRIDGEARESMTITRLPHPGDAP
jgi:8-oxo-dGTP diphosphatase